MESDAGKTGRISVSGGAGALDMARTTHSEARFWRAPVHLGRSSTWVDPCCSHDRSGGLLPDIAKSTRTSGCSSRRPGVTSSAPCFENSRDPARPVGQRPRRSVLQHSLPRNLTCITGRHVFKEYPFVAVSRPLMPIAVPFPPLCPLTHSALAKLDIRPIIIANHEGGGARGVDRQTPSTYTFPIPHRGMGHNMML